MAFLKIPSKNFYFCVGNRRLKFLLGIDRYIWFCILKEL